MMTGIELMFRPTDAIIMEHTRIQTVVPRTLMPLLIFSVAETVSSSPVIEMMARQCTLTLSQKVFLSLISAGTIL